MTTIAYIARISWLKLPQKHISVVVVFLILLCCGCASTSFSRYQGKQAAWPISQGSFVEKQNHGVDVIRGLPSRPYELVGSVEGSGMERKNMFGGRSIYSPDVLGAIAQIAKRNGADAIVLLSSEREFAGFFNYQQTYTSPTYAFGIATTMGNVTTINLQSSEATTTSWGYTAPMYERSYRALAIRYIENYPEPHFLLNGQQVTAAQLREYYYRQYPDQKGREALVTSVTPWINWPQSGTLDQGLKSLASQVREVVRHESKDSMSGVWYGYFTQTTQLANGPSKTGSVRLRVSFTQTQNRLLGNGSLDSGEMISLQGDIEGARITGSLINTTSSLESTFSGVASNQQFTGDFSGNGSGQTFTGIFTLYR
jgi:hypothetical protein